VWRFKADWISNVAMYKWAGLTEFSDTQLMWSNLYFLEIFFCQNVAPRHCKKYFLQKSDILTREESGEHILYFQSSWIISIIQLVSFKKRGFRHLLGSLGARWLKHDIVSVLEQWFQGQCASHEEHGSHMTFGGNYTHTKKVKVKVVSGLSRVNICVCVCVLHACVIYILCSDVAVDTQSPF